MAVYKLVIIACLSLAQMRPSVTAAQAALLPIDWELGGSLSLTLR